MKTILILCRHEERDNYDQVSNYQSEMTKVETKNKYVYGELENVLFMYDGRSLSVLLDGVDISEYDGLFLVGRFKEKILEDIAHSVAVYMYAHKKTVLNTEALYTRSRSKLSQYVVAALNEISMTPFLFAKNKKVFMDNFSRLWTGGYPVILKGALSSRGNDNYLVKEGSEACSLVDATDAGDGPFLIAQGYVPNDGDYRVIVMGDQVEYVIHRVSSNESHINNISKGGDGETVDPSLLPDTVRMQCVDLAKYLRREVTGVDMIQHRETGQFYLLEINNMPQMATGYMVEHKLQRLDNYLSRAIEAQ